MLFFQQMIKLWAQRNTLLRMVTQNENQSVYLKKTPRNELQIFPISFIQSSLSKGDRYSLLSSPVKVAHYIVNSFLK